MPVQPPQLQVPAQPSPVGSIMPAQPAPVQPVPIGQVVPAPQVFYQNWIGKKPEFSGKPEEDAESPLLSTRDWMEAHNFPNEVKVRHFQLTLRLRMCKKISYEFYHKELFLVKHKSKYCCESVIYFNLGSDIIKENCNVAYYLTKPILNLQYLMVEMRLFLANWPDNKHMVCNVNNDIPVKIPNFPYILVNRSVLCNCGIESENKFVFFLNL